MGILNNVYCLDLDGFNCDDEKIVKNHKRSAAKKFASQKINDIFCEKLKHESVYDNLDSSAYAL